MDGQFTTIRLKVKHNDELQVEHLLLPSARAMLAPSQKLADAADILQIADLHELYKVFERC